MFLTGSASICARSNGRLASNEEALGAWGSESILWPVDGWYGSRLDFWHSSQSCCQ